MKYLRYFENEDAYNSAVAEGLATPNVSVIKGESSARYLQAPSMPAVDLGLSVKWASYNLGASKPEEYGDYYAWGETTGYAKDSGHDFSSSTYSASSISTNLSGTNDAATVKLGSKWSMPTKDQCAELKSGTYNGWTADYNGTGVAGYIFYKKVDGKTSFSAYSLSDTHIFMPAAGGFNGTTLYNAGSYGCYWSSTYGDSDSAYGLLFGDGYCLTGSGDRYYGRSVRAVCSE